MRAALLEMVSEENDPGVFPHFGFVGVKWHRNCDPLGKSYDR
jgi:hypothetical protein